MIGVLILVSDVLSQSVLQSATCEVHCGHLIEKINLTATCLTNPRPVQSLTSFTAYMVSVVLPASVLQGTKRASAPRTACTTCLTSHRITRCHNLFSHVHLSSSLRFLQSVTCACSLRTSSTPRLTSSLKVSGLPSAHATVLCAFLQSAMCASSPRTSSTTCLTSSRRT
jgi:hypothetical protein